MPEKRAQASRGAGPCIRQGRAQKRAEAPFRRPAFWSVSERDEIFLPPIRTDAGKICPGVLLPPNRCERVVQGRPGVAGRGVKGRTEKMFSGKIPGRPSCCPYFKASPFLNAPSASEGRGIAHAPAEFRRCTPGARVAAGAGSGKFRKGPEFPVDQQSARHPLRAPV